MWGWGRRLWLRATVAVAVVVGVVGVGAVAWGADGSGPVAGVAQATTPTVTPAPGGGPVPFADEAARAHAAPISRLLYETQVRHFPREDCETESDGDGGILPLKPARAAGFSKHKDDEVCENAFATAHAYCPGDLKVIGGGAQLFTRREAFVIDSYPDDPSSWIVHIQRVPITTETHQLKHVVGLFFGGSVDVLPETRIKIWAICAEVAEDESRPD